MNSRTSILSRWVCVVGAVALGAACGSDDEAPQDDPRTRNGSVTADAAGVVAAGTSVAAPAGVALTFTEAATLTDAGAQPVTGAIATTVTRSTSAADLPAAAATLPAGTSLVAFVEIELGAVRTIAPGLDVALDAAPPAAVADTLVIYEFDGGSWARGDSLAVGDGGAVEFSVPRPALWAALRAPPEPPPDPTGVTATATGPTTVQVGWNTVTGATAYHVYYDTTHCAAGDGPALEAAGTKLTFAAPPADVTGLLTSTTYCFVVTAENSAGESGPQPDPAPATTGYALPGVPNGVVATVPAGTPAGTIHLVWNAATLATSYRVYYAETSSGLCDMGDGPALVTNGVYQPFAASPGDVTGLTSGTAYCFVVTGVNASGVGPSVPNPKVQTAP